MFEDEFDLHEFDDVDEGELDDDLLELLKLSFSSSSYDGLEQNDFEDDEENQEDFEDL